MEAFPITSLTEPLIVIDTACRGSASANTPQRFIKSVKKQLLANGITKEYIYNQKPYNDKYYENNKERIQCECGGFYNKSSAYTHRTRVKKHKIYLETLEKPLEILI